MHVIRNEPEVVTPPTTFDMLGLSVDEMQLFHALMGRVLLDQPARERVSAHELYAKINTALYDVGSRETFTVRPNPEKNSTTIIVVNSKT